MNWYKMANFNNWDILYSDLAKKLKRKPTDIEIQKYVQEKMLEENFSDDNKKEGPPLEKQNLAVVAKKKEWKDKIPGGNADGKSPKDYEKSQVERGKKIEFEHSNDPDIAREIAIDHLEEHKDYYVGLEHMENALKEIEERAKKK